MVQRRAYSTASPEAAWSLLARPGRWHEWAPHVRGAWGLGEPEVRLGAGGAARLLGVLPVPAKVTAKTGGRLWTWRVGPVDMVHEVRPARGGCDVVVTMYAPARWRRCSSAPTRPSSESSFGASPGWRLGSMGS